MSDPNQPYHNKGFGISFMWIILVVFIFPLVAMMSIDDTWSRFLKKYGDPITTNCWENSKHEKVCSVPTEGAKLADCKFFRNFCIEEVYRWRAK